MLGDEGDQARRGGCARLSWCLCCSCRLVVPGVQQPADLDQVVGEYAVAAPDAGAIDAVHPSAVPAEAVLEAADPALAAGAPLDQPTEATLVFDQPAGGTGAASARDGDPGHAKVGQFLVDGRLAVAPIGRHGTGRPAGAGDDSPDGGG